MKLIQCDRCGKTEGNKEDMAKRNFGLEPSLHTVKLYARNPDGNVRDLDLCASCQVLANEVNSRFMIATLKREAEPYAGRLNGGIDE